MNNFIKLTEAAGDPSRVRSLTFLEVLELCVCDVVEILEVAQSTASKHLSILRGAGLIQSRREGTWSYYRLSETMDKPGKGFLEYFFQNISDDKRIKMDKRLVSKRMPGICNEKGNM